MMSFIDYWEIKENLVTTTKQSSPVHHSQLITVTIFIKPSVIPLWVSLRKRVPEVEVDFV